MAPTINRKPAVTVVRGLFPLLLATACVPAVAHGPRITRGFSGGLSASLTTGPKYSGGDDGPSNFLYGPTGLNAAYGWTLSANGPALRFGFHVPVPAVFLVQPDVYLQAPRSVTRTFAFGVGVSAWAIELGSVAMPYLQVGRIDDDQSGWYTTQGYFRNDRNLNAHSRPVLRSTAWVPSIAYQRGGSRTTTHFFLTGVFGTQHSRCNAFSDSVCSRDRRTAAFVGMTLERHKRVSGSR